MKINLTGFELKVPKNKVDIGNCENKPINYNIGDYNLYIGNVKKYLRSDSKYDYFLIEFVDDSYLELF